MSILTKNHIFSAKILLVLSLLMFISYLILMPYITTRTEFIYLIVLLIYIFLIAIINNKLGLFLLILTRPCLDIFTSESLFNFNNISINFAAIIGIITLFFGVYIALNNLDKIKNMPLKFPWAVFLFLTFILSFFSFDKTASFSEWLRLLSIFALYLIGYMIIKKEDLGKFIKIIILSALIPSIFAIYQYLTDTGLSIPFEGIYNRIYGTFAHPNLLAFYLIMPIALSLFIFLTGEKKKINYLFYLIPLFGYITVLSLTYTRGAWLAFIILIFIIGVLRYRLFLISFFIIIFFFYIGIEPINNRVNDLLKNNPDSSISWRINLWKNGMKYISEKPLLGYGTGTSKELILKKRGPQYGSSDPHNDYLKITLENGFLGLVSYIFLIISLMYNLAIKYKNFHTPKFKTLYITFLSITISFYILSFADNILRNTALEWTYWSLIGALLAVVKKGEKI